MLGCVRLAGAVLLNTRGLFVAGQEKENYPHPKEFQIILRISVRKFSLLRLITSKGNFRAVRNKFLWVVYFLGVFFLS